jgi:hypothetical protein
MTSDTNCEKNNVLLTAGQVWSFTAITAVVRNYSIDKNLDNTNQPIIYFSTLLIASLKSHFHSRLKSTQFNNHLNGKGNQIKVQTSE